MIEKMTAADIDQVVAIENDVFQSPWKKENFEYEINENELSRMFVEKKGDEVISYGGLWLLFENADITTIGVKREYQHLGYGKRMMNRLIKAALEEGCEFVHLEVRVSNEKAISLYKKYGFEILRVRKGYYDDNHEDAYDMMKGICGLNAEDFSD